MFEAFTGHSDRLPQAIGFRPITTDDQPFLARLYASTREEELRQVPWSREQKDEFLGMQFQAQHRYYQEHFHKAQFLVIEQDGSAIGRVYLDRREDEIRLIDIALTPDCRGAGLGSQLLLDLLDEARARQLPVRIHVEQFNPAMRLYLRLGFKKIEDQGVYHLMEWTGAANHADEAVAIGVADNSA
ncbi:MAG: GNAT family N-acetyltransferase [Wenzhouxiangellaceae bacterium]